MKYRGFNIVKEKWSGESIIWVETPEGPFDAPTVQRAKQYIDAIIEERAQPQSSETERAG